MARYSALAFIKDDGTLDTELVETALNSPLEASAPQDEPSIAPTPKNAPEAKKTAFSSILPSLGSETLAELDQWRKSLTPKERVADRLKGFDIDRIPEDRREGYCSAIFEDCVTNPQYLGWGAASANERAMFGKPYGSKTGVERLKMLKEWAEKSVPMASDEETEFAALEAEARESGDWSKVDALIDEKDTSMWSAGDKANKELQVVLDEIKGMDERTKAIYMAQVKDHAQDRNYRGQPLRIEGDTYKDFTKEEISAYNAAVEGIYAGAVAKVREERIKGHREKAANRNLLMRLEELGENLSSPSRAFVAQAARTGVFSRRQFDQLPDAEKAHVVACVRVRRGELDKGFGFIPLKDENGEVINVNRILYGIGKGYSDIAVGTARTLDDWSDLLYRHTGVKMSPMALVSLLDPKNLSKSMPEVLAQNLLADNLKSTEERRTERAKVLADMEFKHLSRYAMTRDVPEADGFWWRSAAGFGDNLAFLNVAGLRRAGASYGKKAAEVVSKVSRGRKLGILEKYVFSGAVKEGVKETNLAAVSAVAPSEVRDAVSAYNKAVAALPKAKAEYNFALKRLETAQKTGVGAVDAARAVDKASANYVKTLHMANPKAYFNSGLADRQLFDEAVKIADTIAEMRAQRVAVGKAMEAAGVVAENAAWYLPFYSQHLDRSVAQGLPFEESVYRAFATMLASGFFEKQAFTMVNDMGLPAKKLTEESFKTIATDIVWAFRAKTAADAKSAVGAAARSAMQRLTTDLSHGLKSGFDVTAQSVLDEVSLVMGEIWDEAKADWDRGYTIRRDADGNPIRNFQGDTIVDAFGTKEAFMRFVNAVFVDAKVFDTAVEVVRQGGEAAVGFALFSGANARFGHWREANANQKHLKAVLGEKAYSNLAVKDGGLAEVADTLEETRRSVVDYLTTKALVSQPWESDPAKRSRNVVKSVANEYSALMGEVMDIVSKEGTSDRVAEIAERFGVDAPTAELLKSMADDYLALRWRDDYNSLWGNFAEGMAIGEDGRWRKLDKVLSIRNAEFAFRNFARIAPNVSNLKDNGDGTVTLDVDIGGGRKRTVGIAINERITQGLLENAVKGGEVPSLYEKIHGEGSWDALTRTEMMEFAAQVVEGHNQNGGGFFFVDSDGNRRMIPIKDVADFVTLTGKATGHSVSHEVSHTIYRGAEELGYITLGMKKDIADLLGVDRASAEATAPTGERAPDGHIRERWEVAVDEMVADGYADYVNGRSMPAIPAMREGFDKVNRVWDFFRQILLAEPVNEKSMLDSFYDMMFRGDAQNLAKTLAAIKERGTRDARERAEVIAKTEELSKRIRGLAAKDGAGSQRFKLAAPDYEPKTTYHGITGKYLYKAMRVVDGHLEFPMAGTGEPVPVGKWLVAEDKSVVDKDGKRVTKLRFGSKDIGKDGKPRSNSGTAAPYAGFHMGDAPYMAHIGLGGTPAQKLFQNADYVWVAVDVPMDRTDEYAARVGGAEGERAMRGVIPDNGIYWRKTNPNMEGKWGVAGQMRIVDVLSDDAVDEVLDKERPNRVRMGRQGGGRFNPATMTFEGQDLRKWNLVEEARKAIADQHLERLFPESRYSLGSDRLRDQVLTPEFKAWFGDSKVVDRSGNPQVVYHGTPNGKFWTFDRSRIGETWNADEAGFFFTSDRAQAEEYMKPYFRANTADPNLFAVYLSIQNPLIVDRRWWMSQFGRGDIYNHDAVEIWDDNQQTILDAMAAGGHDGVIIDPNPMGGAAKMYMVPNPTQIKSATDNTGAFDATNPDIRYSLSSIFTGSAADYEKPSLHAIGTGEGSQVYGWGLYGSAVRGVGEGYATYRDSDHAIILVDGKEWKPAKDAPIGERTAYEQLDDFSNSPEEIAKYCESQEGEHYKEAAKFIRSHNIEIKEPHTYLYEQTFFTDRAAGDESHLLSWYEPVSEENMIRIKKGLEKENLGARIWRGVSDPSWYLEYNDEGESRRLSFGEKPSGDDIYTTIGHEVFHSAQKMSEFLARAGVDGVKYPVDSYGKMVKDGDEVGWNYVSFRDDNIRVDHKWVDGEQRFSLSAPAGAQKSAYVEYPDAADEIRAMGEGRFSLGGRKREEAKSLILKKRPDVHRMFTNEQLGVDAEDDLSPERWSELGAERAVDEIAKFKTPKEQKAALNWFIKGSIRLPEDAPKVTEALGYADRAKGKANTDALSYASPMAMIEALHQFKPKAEPINPDTVPQLTDKKVLPEGVTTYQVDDTREGQQAMREIINTHWGEDANPWCLLHGDGKGNLSDGSDGGYNAWYYWNHYKALPKRVAFKDGKLLAFMATDQGADSESYDEYYDRMTAEGEEPLSFVDWQLDFDEKRDIPEQWWDRQDMAHTGIPLGNSPVPNDQFGRWADFEIRDGKMRQVGGFIRRGAKGNEVQWYVNGIKAKEATEDGVLQWAQDGALEHYAMGGKYASFNREDNPLDTIWVNKSVALRLKDGTWFTGNVSTEGAERIYAENRQTPPEGRFSLADSEAEYRSAVAEGDYDRAETLVRRAASIAMPNTKVVDADSLPKVVFHRTENRFTEFDLGKARRSMDIQGFYFYGDNEAGLEYGTISLPCFLNFENPYIVDSAEKMNAIPWDMTTEGAGVRARAWLVDNGYDGVVRTKEFMGDSADEYIALYPEQVKLADAETYADEDGEQPIGLAQRMNLRSRDIRYSLTDDGVDGRYSVASLALAAALSPRIENKGKPNERFVGFFKGGEKVDNVTRASIMSSPIGRLLDYSLERGDFGEGAKARKVRDGVADLFAAVATTIAKTGDAAFGQQLYGSAVFTGIKANSDAQYGTTYDFPSICTKTQAMIDAMSENMVRLGRGLGKDEILALYQHIFDLGAAVPCPECYVFSRWIGIGGMLDNLKSYQERFGAMTPKEAKKTYKRFADEINATVEAWNEANPDDQITFGKGRGKVAAKYTKEWKDLKESIEETINKGYEPKKADLAKLAHLEASMTAVKAMAWLEDVYFEDAAMTKRRANFAVPDEVLFNLNGADKFATEYPEAWNWRCTQGAGYGKAITPYAEASLGEGIQAIGGALKTMIDSKKAGKFQNRFIGDTLKKDARKTLDNAVGRMKTQSFLGGQRFQSTSDARFENMTDYLLAHFEVQTMGGMVQLYTKVLSAVPFFAKAGDSVNMSLMPDTRYGGIREVDGNLVPADTPTGGADPAKARELRKRFDSAGTITIGVNDEHVRLLSRQDWRDFIIPYHASGGDASVVSAMREIQEGFGRLANRFGTPKAKYSTDYTTTQSDKVLSDTALKTLWGLGDAEVERVHKTRDTRLAILTGKGEIDMEFVRSSKFLQRLYDKFKDPSGEWYGVKVAKGKVDGHIFPNEFFDTSVKTEKASKIWTMDYLEYCRELGYLHRFSGCKVAKGKVLPAKGRDRDGNEVYLQDLFFKDGEVRHNKFDFTKKQDRDAVEDYMWKVLVDRRMLDNRGRYQAQKRINLGNVDFGDLATFAENQEGVRNYDTYKAANDHAKVEDLLAARANEGRAAMAATERFSLAIPAELSNAFTAEDLLRLAAAGRIAKNKGGEESVKSDIATRLRALNPNATDNDVERILGAAKRDAAAITGGMEATADAEIMNRLTARELDKYLSSLRRSGRKGISAGVESERARQTLDERMARKVADSVAAQTGISANELEATYGIDLAETMVALGDLYGEADRAKGGGDEGTDEGETLADTTADDVAPLSAEEQAKREADIRELVNEIVTKAWEKDESAKRRSAERKAKAAAEDKAGEGEDAEGEDAPAPTTAETLAEFIVSKQAVDLRNPNQFALFVALLAEEKWKREHDLPADEYIWKDPVALQHLRMTAAQVYDSLARKLMYSNRREVAFNSITEMESAPSYAALIDKMEFTGRVIAQGMVTEKARDLITDIEHLLKEAFGAKGRFSQNKEQKDRKVNGLTELWARDVRKVLRWGDERISKEYETLMQRLSGAEAEFLLADRDPNSSKQFAKDMRLLGVLHDFGGLVHRSLGEITDARAKIVERLENDTTAVEAEAREERTLAVAEMITAAVDAGRKFAYDDPRSGMKAGKAVSRYFQEHLDFKHLLLDLARYCKDEAAKARYEEWVDNLQHEIQRRWDAARTEMRVEALALKAAIENIYGEGYDSAMKRLLAHDERFDGFGEMIERLVREAKPDGTSLEDLKKENRKKETERKYKVAMSKAQAMNLYVALQQKGYLDNLVKNGREGQAMAIRRLFDKEDLQMLKWLGDWYDKSRAGLSEVSLKLFGIPVEAEESNYFPVTPFRPTQGLNETSSDTWSPFPPALTPRVKHGLDFDVRTDIFSVWVERMRDQAQWKAMAEFGVELRGIFGRQGLQSAIRHHHGEAALKNIKAFINDILRGKAQSKGRNDAIDAIRGWTALAALGGNLGVTIKQMTSMPAFLFEVDFLTLAKYANPAATFSSEGIAAMRDLWNSNQRKNRADFANWKSGQSEEVENAMNSNDPSLLRKVMQKSMVFNAVGDLVPSLLVGQGIYRSFLARGLDKDEAMNRTWEIINRTQQTGQMDNLTAWQRRSSLGRFATQFQTTVRQYAAYEIAALRNLLANPKGGKEWSNAVKTTMLNLVLSSTYYFGGVLWQWILGRDPDEETLDGWLKSMLTSCWSSLFFLGSFASTLSDIAVDGKTRQGESIPSMALTGTVLVDAFTAVRDVLDPDKDADDVWEAVDHGLKALFSPYRDATKLYRQRVLGEKPNQKSLRKKPIKKRKPLKRKR